MQKHVVIIEDNLNALEAMQLLLEEDGYQVTALTALNDVESLLALDVDCFILDEQLPVISGHIICILLKSKPETKDKPVILISAHDEVGQYASLCQADGYLRKPFKDIGELLSAVKKVLKQPDLAEIHKPVSQ